MFNRLVVHLKVVGTIERDVLGLAEALVVEADVVGDGLECVLVVNPQSWFRVK
jgi:hypothetical protein